MGVVEEALRLVLEIRGAVEGQGLEPRSLARPSSRSTNGARDDGDRSTRVDGSPAVENEMRAGVGAGEESREFPVSPMEQDVSLGASSRDRAGLSPGPDLDTGDLPSALIPSPSLDDFVMSDHAIISAGMSTDGDGLSIKEVRQKERIPAGSESESDPARLLQQLPAALRRLQERTDAVEEAVNRALEQLIRTQEMMASRLSHLDQKSRRSFRTAEQVGDYLDHPGPSALNFGGP